MSRDWYPGGWFGASWGAAVCDPETHLDTPVDWLCGDCLRPIEADDRGMLIPFTYGELKPDSGRYEPAGMTLVGEHLACFLRGLGVADG